MKVIGRRIKQNVEAQDDKVVKIIFPHKLI